MNSIYFSETKDSEFIKRLHGIQQSIFANKSSSALPSQQSSLMVERIGLVSPYNSGIPPSGGAPPPPSMMLGGVPRIPLHGGLIGQNPRLPLPVPSSEMTGGGLRASVGDDSDSDEPMVCEICDDKATGLHYGIITCEG